MGAQKAASGTVYVRSIFAQSRECDVLKENSHAAMHSVLPIQRHWSHLIIVVYWSVLFAGCVNTCFVAVSNPPNGTIGILAGNPPPACSLITAKGAVRVITRANRVCEFCSESNRLKSIVLSLKASTFIGTRIEGTIPQAGWSSTRNLRSN